MDRQMIVFAVVMLVLISCAGTKSLFYRDDWEGNYTLKESSPCCDSATRVRLIVSRKIADKYTWKLFFNAQGTQDTVYGEANYIKKQLKFFVSDPEKAGRYFKQNTETGSPVFRMEYDNYYTEGETMHIGCYTRWYNELIGYQKQNKLFAGVSYHFQKNNGDGSFRVERVSRNK